MVKDSESAEKADDTAAAKSWSKKDLIIVVLLGVLVTTLLIGVSVGITYVLVSARSPANGPVTDATRDEEVAADEEASPHGKAEEDDKDAKHGADDEGKGKSKSKGQQIYIDLKPEFVVNFQDREQHTKYLKAELSVVTADPKVEDNIAKHMPAIRNNLVLLFSRQIYDDLLSNEGKEKLRGEALAEVQGVLKQKTGKTGVEDLYFSSFVMQ